MSRLRLLQAQSAADSAWMAEIQAIFGKRYANLERTKGRANGETGTRLRALHDAFVSARDAYRSARFAPSV